MLNLHAPFRSAIAEDRSAIASLGRENDPAYAAIADDLAGCVVAEDGGQLVAVMHAVAAEGAWQIDLMAIALDRIEDLGPRLLAIADAQAADEGLARVCLNAASAGATVWFMLDQEGFRPIDPPPGLSGSGWFGRDVIPGG